METPNNQNQEQFLRLLMLNDNRIYAYILSIVPNMSDADDIMQETSAVMWRKFSDFKDGMNFVAWGMTVARYQILSHFKKIKQSRIRFSEDIMKSIEEDVIKVLPEMDTRLNALKECITKLGQTERTLLKLRYEKGYTLKNIGAYISKSTRATYYSLVRIHKYLSECVRRNLAGEHS